MNSRVLPQFDLMTPQNLPEAVEMLGQYQDQVSILAGGTDLLIWKYLQKNHTPYLLSLSGLEGLDYINYLPGSGLLIGAKAKVAQLLTHPAIKEKYRALYQAAFTFATPQIRNMATVLGNILRASPAGDCCCAVLALGGQVVLQGPQGERVVNIDDFWISYGVTARKSDELAVELRIPDPASTTRTAFHRLTRVHEDLAKLNVAVRLELQQTRVLKARLAMGCVGPTPLRLRKTEGLLEGAELTESLLQTIAASALEEIVPIDDQRSTAEYRRKVAGVMLRRSIECAASSH